MNFLQRSAKRIIAESLGWTLLGVGIAALILPGPGLLMIFAGLALLATQYDWAERRLKPVRTAALKTAKESVQSWPRLGLSTLLSFGLIGLGLLWGIRPPSPAWWPFAERWWLVGGWGAGTTLIFSGLVAFSVLLYSFFLFRSRTP